MTKQTLSILGCGWLGKAVGERFVKAGWRVLGSTTQAANFEMLAAKGITPALIQLNPAPSGDVDVFFDADVLLISVPPKRKSGLTDVFLHQVEAVAEVCARKKIKRVIFISSTSVYGEMNRSVIESDADPSSYLVIAENFLVNRQEFLTTVLRFGGLVGPARHPGRFLSAKQNVDGADVPVNIIHQEDCVNIIFEIVRQDVFGEIFNACADEHPSKRTFYTGASLSLNLPPPSFNENGNTAFKIVMSDKLKRTINYTFSFSDPMGML
jgi:nucleoside-diphosphate-sugar epimerase